MDEILTARDVAKQFKLPLSTVTYLVTTNQIPFFRVGKRSVRFKRSSLEQWAKENEGREYRLGPRRKEAEE